MLIKCTLTTAKKNLRKLCRLCKIKVLAHPLIEGQDLLPLVHRVLKRIKVTISMYLCIGQESRRAIEDEMLSGNSPQDTNANSGWQLAGTR